MAYGGIMTVMIDRTGVP